MKLLLEAIILLYLSQPSPAFELCSGDDVRLVPHSDIPRGIGGVVEICTDEDFEVYWTRACHPSWGHGEAEVVCHQLGLLTSEPAIGYLVDDEDYMGGVLPYTCPNFADILQNCDLQLDVRCVGRPRPQSAAVICPRTAGLPSTDGPVSTVLTTNTSSPGNLSFDPDPIIIAVPTIIGALLVLSLVLLLIIVICVAKRRHRKSARFHMHVSNPEYHNQLPVTDVPANDLRSFERTNQPTATAAKIRGSLIQQITDSFVIPLMSLTILELIGEGEFGVVHKAKLSGSSWKNQVVAVKTLKGYQLMQEEVDSILEEGLKLKHFQHQNVLSLIGVCVEASPAPYIITPFMSNGSLLKYLRKNKSTLVLSAEADEKTVSDVSKRLTAMCLQISEGMKYLASKRFVHRDLAARNCMIDDNYMIKIADFGLSEDIYTKLYFRQPSHSTVRLPIKWLAIESLQEGIFTEKTDVWSFGVTCWEVFSGGKNPYPGVSVTGVVEALEQGERMPRPNNAACTKTMCKLIRQCWQQDPADRPTFASISDLIDKQLQEMVVGSLDTMICPFPEKAAKPVKQSAETAFTWRRSRSSVDTTPLKVDKQAPETGSRKSEHFM